MARLFLPLTCLLFLTVSCATSSNPFDRIPGPGREGRNHVDMMVRVQNDHYLPVRVSAVWEQMDYFLGEIQPGATETIRLPGYLLESQGSPQFLADPRGSTQEFLTPPVNCEGARWIQWQLKRNLHQSRPFVLRP